MAKRRKQRKNVGRKSGKPKPVSQYQILKSNRIIFLSHDHCDAELAIELSEKLENIFQKRIKVFCSSRERDKADVPENYRASDSSMKTLGIELAGTMLRADAYWYLWTKKSLRMNSCIVRAEMLFGWNEVLSRIARGHSYYNSTAQYPDFRGQGAYTIILANGAKIQNVPPPDTDFFLKLPLDVSDIESVHLKKSKENTVITEGLMDLILSVAFRYQIVNFDLNQDCTVDSIEQPGSNPFTRLFGWS